MTWIILLIIAAVVVTITCIVGITDHEYDLIFKEILKGKNE